MDIASEIIKKQVTSSQKNHDAATVCDMLTYELDGDRLIVKRVAPPTDVELSALQDTLSEWRSKEDDEAWPICWATNSANQPNNQQVPNQFTLAIYNVAFRQFSRDAMECTVRWTGLSGMTFVAETGSGHLVTMDGAPEGGGRNLAPRPMEVVLAGTGGCTAYDVVVILRKSGQDIRGCDLSMKSERAEKDPKVFTKVHFHFTVRGRNLKPNLVERAIKLSHEKYCSASIMMEKTAELTHSFEIVDDETDTIVSA